MNLKKWRNSAVVLLTSSKQLVTNHQMWRKQPAVFKNEPKAPNESVLILMEKRKSKTFQEAHVFPGGLVSASDFSKKWLKVLQPRESDLSQLLSKNIPGPVPMIYQSRTNPIEESLPSELGLRICAIRELFEETGILLAQKCNTNLFSFEPQHTKEWQLRVQNDPACFVELFETENMYPALWYLHDWWSWLTPTDMPYRFDTMFYMCCLKQLPPLVSAEESEVSALEWLRPQTVLQLHQDRKIILHVPQIYELARLSSFDSFQELQSFAQSRSKLGTKTWFPVIVRSPNSHHRSMSLLPGDGYYPKNPDIFGEREHLQGPLDSENQARNRVIYDYDKTGIRLDCNIEPDCGHVVPDLTLLK